MCVKNENNLSYYESLHYINEQKKKKTIILGFDNVSRRYNLNDIVWIVITIMCIYHNKGN